MEEVELARKYPFLPLAKRFVLQKTTPQIIELAKKRVITAINNQREYVRRSRFLPAELEVSSYALARAILSALGSRYFINRYIVAEAKLAHNLFKLESDPTLLIIAEWLGMKVEHDHDYLVDVFTYLNFAPSHQKKWKLVNREIKDGKVVLRREEFVRLLEERVKAKISEGLPIPEERIPENVKAIAESLKGFLKAPTFEVKLREVNLKALPPCISRLLSLLKAGENLSHIQRWVLAVFLLNIGMSVDHVVRTFSTLPDFREEVTRYQVEHAAGLRGSKKRYKMVSCATMRSYGLCTHDCGVRNPISLYLKRLRKMKRKGGEIEQA